jgi:hypothetical protein
LTFAATVVALLLTQLRVVLIMSLVKYFKLINIFQVFLKLFTIEFWWDSIISLKIPHYDFFLFC